MAKKKKSKGKSKARKNPRRVKAAEKAYKGSALHKYNLKRGKHHGGEKTHSKKKSGGKGRHKAYGKHSFLGYKAHAKTAHDRKVIAALRHGMIESLVAKGKPPAIAKKIVDRTLRVKKGLGKKKSAYFEKRRSEEAAARAAAYLEQHYAKAHSYN